MRIWSWITNIFTTVSLVMAPVLSSVMAAPAATALNTTNMNAKSTIKSSTKPVVISNGMGHQVSRRAAATATKLYCETDADCFHGGECIMGDNKKWSACQCRGDIWAGGKCQHISNLWQCRQNKKTKRWTLEINQGDGYRISKSDCSWIDTEYSKILGSDMLRCVNTADGLQKFIYNSFKTDTAAQRAIDWALVWATDVWDAFQVLQDVELAYPGAATQALVVEITDTGRYKIQSRALEYNLCNYWETALEAATLSIPNACTVSDNQLCQAGQICRGSLSEYQCELAPPDGDS